MASALEKMVALLKNMLAEAEKSQLISEGQDNVWFFANQHFAEVRFDLGKGFYMRKTLFIKDDEDE